MKRRTIFLLLVLSLATVLRVYNLGTNPPSAYGDEISFAWNAWSILKTGTDEYGNRLPLQFRAFDDYKSPLPVYLLAPFIKILGLNTFAVRLPVMIFSVATIWVMYLLVRELFKNKDREEVFALVAALFLAISPWHIHLSRGFFESTIALFFFVAGIYCWLKSTSERKYLIFSAGLFVLTLYTYFTPRILLLLFIPFLLLWSKDWVRKDKKNFAKFLGILGLFSLPLVYATFFNQGFSRMDKLLASKLAEIEKNVVYTRNAVNSPRLVQRILHNKPVYFAGKTINDYLEHFSLNFLYIYGDNSLRYFLGNMGMFYRVELIFSVVGLYWLFRKHRQIFWFVVGWWLLAPIPAAISGRPFAVRSLAMLPAVIIPTALGFWHLWAELRKMGLIGVIGKSLLVICIVVSLGHYLVRYHLEYPSYGLTWWGGENKLAIDLALAEQEKYDQVIIANPYSGMELALAYYLQYDPKKYKLAKERKVKLADDREFIQLGKFYIGSLHIDEARLAQVVIPANTLYIGAGDEGNSSEVITAPEDDRILYRIYRNEKSKVKS